MFFVVSKVLWSFLAPLNLILLMVVAGGILFHWGRRAAIYLWAASALLFICLGLLPVGPLMMANLENKYQRPATLPDAVDGIIVLGGAFETSISHNRQDLALNEGADRVFEAIRLARLYPDAVLVFSGGEGKLRTYNHTEAQDTVYFLESIGFDADRPVYEDRSRNTYENALFTSEMMPEAAGKKWLLVTSAYHMDRAVKVFHTQGWGGIIPWPVDYRTTGREGLWPQRFDVSGNIYKFELAMKEYTGQLAYRLTGKIASP